MKRKYKSIYQKFNFVITIKVIGFDKYSFMNTILLDSVDNFMTNIYGFAAIHGKPCRRETMRFYFVTNGTSSWVRVKDKIYTNDPNVLNLLQSKLSKHLNFKIKKNHTSGSNPNMVHS